VSGSEDQPQGDQQQSIGPDATEEIPPEELPQPTVQPDSTTDDKTEEAPRPDAPREPAQTPFAPGQQRPGDPGGRDDHSEETGYGGAEREDTAVIPPQELPKPPQPGQPGQEPHPPRPQEPWQDDPEPMQSEEPQSPGEA
jgi:hypothetical protein